MALIRIDLSLPDSEAKAPESGAIVALRLAGSVFRSPLVLVALLALGGAIWKVGEARTERFATRDRLRVEIQQAVQDSIRSAGELIKADSLKKTQAQIEAQLAKISKADGNRYSFIHLMDAVAATLPADSWIQGLKTTEQDTATRNVTILVSGVVPSEQAVTEMLSRLNENRWVGEASLVSSTRIPLGRQALFRFEVLVRSELAPVEFWNTLTTTAIAQGLGDGGLVPGVNFVPGSAASSGAASVFGPQPTSTPAPISPSRPQEQP